MRRPQPRSTGPRLRPPGGGPAAQPAAPLVAANEARGIPLSLRAQEPRGGRRRRDRADPPVDQPPGRARPIRHHRRRPRLRRRAGEPARASGIPAHRGLGSVPASRGTARGLPRRRRRPGSAHPRRIPHRPGHGHSGRRPLRPRQSRREAGAQAPRQERQGRSRPGEDAGRDRDDTRGRAQGIRERDGRFFRLPDQPLRPRRRQAGGRPRRHEGGAPGARLGAGPGFRAVWRDHRGDRRVRASHSSQLGC